MGASGSHSTKKSGESLNPMNQSSDKISLNPSQTVQSSAYKINKKAPHKELI
jgi:hypothetical protein